MKKLSILILSTLLLAGCSSAPSSQLSDPTADTTIVTQSEELSLQQVLNLAYLDELKAEATYQYVIETFGEVRPFTNIINAEVKHSQSVYKLYEQFGLVAPEFQGIDDPSFATIQEACQAGVTAEIENIELYDTIIEQTNEPSVINPFENLRRASKENHLPAFQRCS